MKSEQMQFFLKNEILACIFIDFLFYIQVQHYDFIKLILRKNVFNFY